jgi:PGF-CTERM protein
MLTAHGEADYADGAVYEIGEESDFPGAYGVEQDGTSVTITHAPSPEGVLELRPDADLALPDADGTDGADGSDGDDTDGADGNSSDDGDTDGADGSDGDDGSGTDGSDGGNGSEDTNDSTPGFGVAAALVALVAALGLAARRAK